ncbi:carbohydrate ABC transporter permease [Pseudonocardia nigra]|uniref:carbohydrate ABC transporter permease n=1 Tax=Pseudonocardia nigra TaxID=1921578 RepID=UPI001C5D8244|nr:sugar ABC transporter permease [Pseudonocardia nigra]
MALTTSPPAEVPPARSVATDAAGLGRIRATAFVAPGLALVGVFLVFPALWTLYLGLTNYRLTGIAAARPEVVGLDNYATALTDPDFLHSLWLTLIYVIGSAVIGQTVLGFVLAWTMRGLPRTVRTVVESLVMLAWILPSSVIAFLWIALLDRDSGTLNALLGTPGMAWLLEYPMLSIIIFNTWRGTAFSMLLFSAALNAVPPSQLETARMSGASGWQQLRDVVFPHIRGHILTNLLLISLWTFNDFGPYLITAGGPNGQTEILPVFVYQTAISNGELGLGSAISLIMLLINLVMAVVYLRLLRERSS